MCRTGHFLQTSGDQISGCPGPNKFLHVFSLLRGKGHQNQHPLEIDTSSPSAIEANSTLPFQAPFQAPGLSPCLPPSTHSTPSPILPVPSGHADRSATRRAPRACSNRPGSGRCPRRGLGRSAPGSRTNSLRARRRRKRGGSAARVERVSAELEKVETNGFDGNQLLGPRVLTGRMGGFQRAGLHLTSSRPQETMETESQKGPDHSGFTKLHQ